jgi:hypothetical protein
VLTWTARATREPRQTKSKLQHPAASRCKPNGCSQPCAKMHRRPERIARAFKPIIIVFGALYFLIDAIFFSLIRPLGNWLSKLPIFTGVGRWIRSLGPYSTLALFAVPLIVLEPIKPIGLYLVASGNVIDGTLLIGVGEAAKITIVERIFHAGRDKLMTIPAFAWAYARVMALRTYLETLAVWQAMLRAVRAIKETARRFLAFAKNSLKSLRRAD